MYRHKKNELFVLQETRVSKFSLFFVSFSQEVHWLFLKSISRSIVSIFKNRVLSHKMAIIISIFSSLPNRWNLNFCYKWAIIVFRFRSVNCVFCLKINVFTTENLVVPYFPNVFFSFSETQVWFFEKKSEKNVSYFAKNACTNSWETYWTPLTINKIWCSSYRVET